MKRAPEEICQDDSANLRLAANRIAERITGLNRDGSVILCDPATKPGDYTRELSDMLWAALADAAVAGAVAGWAAARVEPQPGLAERALKRLAHYLEGGAEQVRNLAGRL